MKAMFLLVNLPFLAINIVDLEYFKFTGHRSDLTLLGIAGDPGVKWTTIGLYYWSLALLTGLVLTALFLLYSPLRLPPGSEVKRIGVWTWALNLALAMALAIVAFRGGLQWKPITPAHAAQGQHGLTQLTLNSSFTVIKNSRKAPLKRYSYFSDGEQLRHYLRPLVDGESLLSGPPAKDNIVILVVESLSAEYCGAGNGGGRYTPFLDTLAEQSLFFRQHYANGRRSIEAMPAILAGLPSLMAPSFIESPYCDHPLYGLGTLLSAHGYTTSFFQGAEKGTMNFDVLMRLAGIQNYFGLAEYPNKADHDGDWGIFDEPYLQYAAAQLSLQPPPFAALIFTLSSHHPYPIPPQHRGRFRKGTLEVHESIGYADYSLARFFATARLQPWYSNTLFVITGDHTQKLETLEYANTLGAYRVPLLLFHPGKRFPQVDLNRVTQHADILPSLLDYLRIQPAQRLLFGRSVFRQGEGRAFLHVNGSYLLVRADRALEFDAGGPCRLFNFARDPHFKSPLLGEPERFRTMKREAEALVQYFNNGLLDRQLYDPLAPVPQ